MTTPSHTELAARLRETAQSIRRKPMPLADFIPLLQQAADALESPERVQGEAYKLSDEDINEGAERHGITVAGPRLEDFDAGVRWAELVLANPPDADTPSPQAEKQPLSEADEALMRQAAEALEAAKFVLDVASACTWSAFQKTPMGLSSRSPKPSPPCEHVWRPAMSDTTPIPPASERERFEAEYQRLYPISASQPGKFDEDYSGGYEDIKVQVAWKLWQARADLSHPSTPQGWKLVPVEPCDLLLNSFLAGYGARGGSYNAMHLRDRARQGYRQMLEAVDLAFERGIYHLKGSGDE